MSEVDSLYKERIKTDFPIMERRPLFIIRRLFKQNRYVCLVLEEENFISAYATFICDDAISSVLLDYFAVEKSLRGSGVGSRFLEMLREYWSKKSGIFLECERPDAAKNESEKQNRKRRIRFYQRIGAVIIPVRWRSFGVDYNVLWLPAIHSEVQAAPPKEFLTLYTFSLPSFIKSLFLRLQTE